jgi:pyridoxal phosphate-dependent aminotransferase EpsN
MSKRILLSVPHMGGNEEKYVREAFASNWLSTVGPQIDAFEKEFVAKVNAPAAVALASGTAAMHLGLRLLGVGPGDEVFAPTLTFVASVNPITYQGARPVFIDSSPETWNLDPALLAEALEQRARRGKLPKAVVVVHLYGQSADLEPIMKACAQHGVPVLEDAAEALGTLYRGRQVGTFGDVSAFSFNGNKIITTTGGGMLTAKQEWVDKARFWSTQARDAAPHYQHSELGYNYRLSNVLAAIGRGQLEVLDERVRQRRAVAFRYRDAFSDIPELSLMPQAPYGVHTNWLSCFLVQDSLGRDNLLQALNEADIESRPVWKPMHLQPLFQGFDCFGGAVAEDCFRRGICLPSSSSLSSEEQDRVIYAVRAEARKRPRSGPATR